MGILDELLGKDKKMYKENAPAALASNLKECVSPISLSIRFLPLRLVARRDNKIDMIIRITNETNEKQIVSFEALAPKSEMLGFDSTAINKHYEKKLGYLEPGANTEFVATIYGTNQTKPNNYEINVTAYVHYLNYNKVINYVKRKVVLRVV